MNEAPQLSPSRLPHGVAMSFYNAIKEIRWLYWHSFSIQEEINEEQQRVKCTIILAEPLLPPHEEEIQGGILRLIQTIILPALPQGFKSTIWDIDFVIQEKSRNDTSDSITENDACADSWVVDARNRANDKFADVEVPSRSGLFSGLGLSLSQLLEVLSRRFLPPR